MAVAETPDATFSQAWMYSVKLYTVKLLRRNMPTVSCMAGDVAEKSLALLDAAGAFQPLHAFCIRLLDCCPSAGFPIPDEVCRRLSLLKTHSLQAL